MTLTGLVYIQLIFWHKTDPGGTPKPSSWPMDTVFYSVGLYLWRLFWNKKHCIHSHCSINIYDWIHVYHSTYLQEHGHILITTFAVYRRFGQCLLFICMSFNDGLCILVYRLWQQCATNNQHIPTIIWHDCWPYAMFSVTWFFIQLLAVFCDKSSGSMELCSL